MVPIHRWLPLPAGSIRLWCPGLLLQYSIPCITTRSRAINLLKEVGTNASVPADLIDSGLVNGNESILQWAQQVVLPAYSDVAQV